MSNTSSASSYTGLIEAGVLPLCDVLNAVEGITTHFSCEGHPRSAMPPYVVFSASSLLAQRIEAAIREAHRRRILQYIWRVTGYFNEAGRWLYCIEPNDTRLIQKTWLGIFPRWRKPMIADIRQSR